MGAEWPDAPDARERLIRFVRILLEWERAATSDSSTAHARVGLLTEWEAARAQRSDARAKPVAEATVHDERQS
jgi:hypothetical protein